MTPFSAGRHLGGVPALAAFGVAALAVPLYDLRRDAAAGFPLYSTLVEHLPVVVIAAAFFGTAAYVHRRDWSPAESRRLVGWAVAGAVGGGLVAALLFGVQLWLQEIQPTVLAVQMVLVVAASGLAVGMYDRRSRRRRDALRRERNRFSSLYENSSDAIVELDVRGRPDVLRRNDAFEAAFGDADPFADGEGIDGAFDREWLLAALDADESALEVSLAGPDGERVALATPIRVDDERAFLVLTDISAQKRRERSLREREAELEATATQRERELEERTNQLEFLHSLLRHDVQNGMMVIQSRAEFLAEALDGREGEYANTIVARSENISDQIDRMRTTLGRLSTDEQSLEPVSLSSVARDRTASFADSHPDLDVSTEIADHVTIRADDLLPDVVGNVLGNAAEHGGGSVTVDVFERDGVAHLAVADDGPGVEPDQRDAVFRRGVTSAAEGDDNGSGFGLFFVDTVVDSYGGDARIEESAAGGARVVLTFPSAGE